MPDEYFQRSTSLAKEIPRPTISSADSQPGYRYQAMVCPLLLLFLLCGEQAVMSLPVYEGKEKPSLFYQSQFRQQVQDCLSQELSETTGFSFEIRPGCLYVLQHALFPEGTPVDLNQYSDWLSHTSNKQARAISSEEGLYWLWSLLREDCESLNGLLASLAAHIARKEYEESTNHEVSGVTVVNDYIQKRAETTTYRSDQDQVLDLLRDHMTVDELASLMADRPGIGDLADIHDPLPSRSPLTG